MSDERRAEIEAVDALDALLDRIRWDLRDKGREPQSATWSGAVARAQAVLDHVRDTRGDNMDEHDDEVEARLLARLERDGLFREGMTATGARRFLDG